MNRVTLRRSTPLFLALVLAIGGLQAQDSMPAPAQSAGGAMRHRDMMMKDMNGMQGMHAMPATVTATDPKTGTVDVTAGGMALKVHFPPAAMASLKAGDKISLHMGFSKP